MPTLKYFLVSILCIHWVRAFPFEPPKSYNNHKVVEFKPNGTHQLELIKSYVENHDLGLDLWTEMCPAESQECSVHIRFPPDSYTKLQHTLLTQVSNKVVIQDLQPFIDQERVVSVDSEDISNWHTTYHPYDQINMFLKRIVDQYPSIAHLVTLGTKTYEGRDIFGVKLSSNATRLSVNGHLNEDFDANATKNGKKVIVMHGAIHPREWITAATMQYMITKLVETYVSKKDPVVNNLIDHLEIYIFPVLNADGYVYTHTKERLWRKNRQPNKNTSCIGTDINRNFGFKWKTGGSSNNPCSDVYAGPTSMSTPESKSLTNFIRSFSGRVLFYADIHSFSQLWMFPYGYTCKTRIPNYDKMYEMTRRAVEALSVKYHTQYRFGDICNTIYRASGSSTDHMFSMGVKYSMTLELRPSWGTGMAGFILNPDQIIPTSEETYDGILKFWELMAAEEKIF